MMDDSDSVHDVHIPPCSSRSLVVDRMCSTSRGDIVEVFRQILAPARASPGASQHPGSCEYRRVLAALHTCL